MQLTDIEWTHWSVTPLKLLLPDGSRVNFCVKCSKGCENCYSESNTRRWWRKNRKKFPGFRLPLLKMGEPVLIQDELEAIIRLDERIRAGKADPTVNKVFWNDMTDPFGDWVTDDMLDKMMAVVALTDRLTHQWLTKRIDRAARYFAGRKDGPLCDMAVQSRMARYAEAFAEARGEDVTEPYWDLFLERWPLPNLLIGTSVENQEVADKRIPELLRCPASVRFLSCEPLLGPIDCSDKFARYREIGAELLPAPDWAIIGCESKGKNAGRFADGYQDAARSIIQQCGAADVAPFHKQNVVNGQVSHDPAEWDEDLRVRAFPEVKVVQV